MLRDVTFIPEDTQQVNVRASENCSLVAHHIKPREIFAQPLFIACLPVSPNLAFCPFICLSIHPFIHLSIRPSTLTTSQPRSRLALTVSILKSRALPRLSYFQLQCSTVFSTVFSSLPTWLLSLDKALHLSKPRFLHL